MGCGELMVPCLIEVGVREFLGNVPEDLVAVFKEVKVVFVGFIDEMRLEGRNHVSPLCVSGNNLS